MASELDGLVKTIIEHAATKVLRPAGFAGRSRRFWRSRPELEHLVIFERQSVFEKGVTELWATAAVFVPGYHELRYPPFAEPKRNRITPTDCVLWATADRLATDAEPGSSAQALRVDLNGTDNERRKLTDETEHCLINGVIPFLDLFNSLEDVIDFLTQPRTGLGASAWTSDILCLEAAAVLYALLGNHDKAVEHIDLAIHKTKVAEARSYQHRVKEAISRHCSGRKPRQSPIVGQS